MDDVRAVMDAVGSKRAALFGISEGGPMTLLFAATYPERTTAVVLYGTNGATLIWTPETPWLPTREQLLRRIDELDREGRWGTHAFAREAVAGWIAPSMADDEEFVDWWASYLRLSASPGTVTTLRRMNLAIDIRHVLSSVRVPTLLIHRTGTRFPSRTPATSRHGSPVRSSSNYPAAVTSGPSTASRSSSRRWPFFRRAWAERAWEDEPDRMLATVLFTDIVGSTARAAELGDRAWRGVVEEHHALVRGQLVRHRGREIDKRAALSACGRRRSPSRGAPAAR